MQGWGRSQHFVGTEFQFHTIKKFWRQTVVMVATPGAYLMPLNRTLKSGYDGKFRVTCNLQQFKNILRKARE